MAVVSRKLMSELFKLLVDEFHTQLTEGKTVVTKDGSVEKVSPDAATLNAIRQLLKDNGIEAQPDSEDNPLKKLLGITNLPFPADALAQIDALPN